MKREIRVGDIEVRNGLASNIAARVRRSVIFFFFAKVNSNRDAMNLQA